MAHALYLPFSDVEPKPTAPGDYQRIPTTPREFGAGVAEGEQRLGAGATHAAQFFGQVAADQSTNNWQTEVTNLLHGDPKVPGDVGVYGLEGQAAMDAVPKAIAKMGELRKQYAGQLATPDQQLLFDQYTRRMQNVLTAELGRHYDSQARVWAEGQSNAAKNLATNWISNHAADPEQANHGMADLLEAERGRLARSGVTNPEDPAFKSAMLNTERGGREAQIRSLMLKDPAQAQKLFDDPGIKSLFSGTPAEVSLANALKAHAFQNNVKRAVAEALGAGGGAMAGGSSTPKIGKVIDYAPSPALLGGTGMTSDQYDKFRGHLAANESGSYGEPPNPEGYMGRYQMGSSEIRESAQRLGIPTPTQQQFLSDPQLQEKLFENYTLQHHNELMANPRYASASPSDRAAILAGAHLGGVAGVNNYLATGRDPSDRLGTHISSYVNSMSQVMGARQAATDLGVQGGLVPSGGVTPAYRSSGLTAALDHLASMDLAPEEKESAAKDVERRYRDQQIEQDRFEAAQRRATKEASDQRANQIVTDMAGPNPAITVNDVRADPHLEWQTKEHLIAAMAAHPGSDPVAATMAYGAGFWDAYRGVVADPGDSNRITDMNAILRRAGPGGDLSLAGAKELGGIFEKVHKPNKPEAIGEEKVRAGALAYAKHQLSFEADYGTFKVRDPKGEDRFNIGLTPAFFKYWQDGIAAGKSPQELTDKAALDRLIEPFKRSPAEEMADHEAADETYHGAPTAAKGAMPSQAELEKMGPQALAAAVREHPALRSQAEAIAVRQGWIRATPAPPIAGAPQQ